LLSRRPLRCSRWPAAPLACALGSRLLRSVRLRSLRLERLRTAGSVCSLSVRRESAQESPRLEAPAPHPALLRRSVPDDVRQENPDAAPPESEGRLHHRLLELLCRPPRPVPVGRLERLRLVGRLPVRRPAPARPRSAEADSPATRGSRTCRGTGPGEHDRTASRLPPAVLGRASHARRRAVGCLEPGANPPVVLITTGNPGR
ncbi:MAG: hypothetical protein RLY70_3914, partial [Planctomycetota bacterium]